MSGIRGSPESTKAEFDVSTISSSSLNVAVRNCSESFRSLKDERNVREVEDMVIVGGYGLGKELTVEPNVDSSEGSQEGSESRSDVLKVTVETNLLLPATLSSRKTAG